MSLGPLFFAKYKASQLKLLAELTGLNTTGTKTVLSETLSTAFSQPARLKPGVGHTASHGSAARILSIDMGIRNLAYAVIEVHDADALQSLNSPRLSGLGVPSALDKAVVAAEIPSILNYITLLAWKRTSLYDALDPPSPSNMNIALDSPNDLKTTQGIELDVPNKLAEVLPSQPRPGVESDIAIPKEAFDPATFASLAYNLVKNVFLPYNISHVLIERQRYRTGGASAIMEWTVRVNTLESMLHAVFRTLRCEQQALLADQDPEVVSTDSAPTPEIPQVHSVSPRRVGHFWNQVMPPVTNATGSLPGAMRKPLERSKVEKEVKIAIAASFFADSTTSSNFTPLNCAPEAETTKDAFLAARNRTSGRKKGKVRNQSSDTELGSAAGVISAPNKANELVKNSSTKLDDLADCLLQGTAWLQWELNRLVLNKCCVSAAGIADKVR